MVGCPARADACRQAAEAGSTAMTRVAAPHRQSLQVATAASRPPTPPGMKIASGPAPPGITRATSSIIRVYPSMISRGMRS
jgi:hypothetical protein